MRSATTRGTLRNLVLVGLAHAATTVPPSAVFFHFGTVVAGIDGEFAMRACAAELGATGANLALLASEDDIALGSLVKYKSAAAATATLQVLQMKVFYGLADIFCGQVKRRNSWNGGAKGKVWVVRCMQMHS